MDGMAPIPTAGGHVGYWPSAHRRPRTTSRGHRGKRRPPSSPRS